MSTSSSPSSAKIKYINNKELLAEIHRCKLTYCSFLDQAHASYDKIVHHVDEITPELCRELRPA